MGRCTSREAGKRRCAPAWAGVRGRCWRGDTLPNQFAADWRLGGQRVGWRAVSLGSRLRFEPPKFDE
jgi:hypothetical protein